MNAINGNLFIKPYPKEDIDFDIEVSDNALTRNYKGVVFAVDGYKIVTIGEEVLIPHFGVVDIEFDGEEYALTKVSKLFAKKNGDSYSPVNQYVKVRKCTNDHIRDTSGEVAVYMTENHLEDTNWVEILEVSEECRHMKDKYIGYFCTAPENDEGLSRIGYTKDFCIHEDLIKFVTDGE